MRTILIVAHCDDDNDDKDAAENVMTAACTRLEDVASIQVALTAPGKWDLDAPWHQGPTVAEFMLAAAVEEER